MGDVQLLGLHLGWAVSLPEGHGSPRLSFLSLIHETAKLIQGKRRRQKIGRERGQFSGSEGGMCCGTHKVSLERSDQEKSPQHSGSKTTGMSSEAEGGDDTRE